MIKTATSFGANAARRLYVSRKMAIAARGLLIASLAGGLALAVALPVAAADLHDSTDSSTYTLPSGSFNVSYTNLSTSTVLVAAAVNAATDTITAAGSLHQIVVDDQRGTSGTWNASALYTGFHDTVSTTNLDAPTVTFTVSAASSGNLGNGTTAGSANTVLSPTTNSASLFSLSAFTGRTTTTWIPSLTVKMPASAVAGAYTGTIAYSFA